MFVDVRGVGYLVVLVTAIGCGTAPSSPSVRAKSKADDGRMSVVASGFYADEDGRFLRISSQGEFERAFDDSCSECTEQGSIAAAGADEDLRWVFTRDETVLDAWDVAITDLDDELGKGAIVALFERTGARRELTLSRKAQIGERCDEAVPCEGLLACIDTCEAL